MRLRRSHTEIYLHLVWATWDRFPLITPDLKPKLYANLAHQAAELGADVIAIGGTADHVHLLIRFPATISVSDFAARVKGASSYFVTHLLASDDPFKWQGGYGAFSLWRRGLATVREYVLNQEEHHRGGTLVRALEPAD
jgi:putative transposase